MPESVELATGYLSLAVSTKNMGRDIARGFQGAERYADDAGKRSGKRFGGAFKGLAVAGIAGAIAGAGVAAVKGISGAIAEAREAEKVGKTTAQIIKSTGGAAKVSAGDVEALATAISKKAGMDDEVIQKGANLLLTFKNVRNEAGAGSKIFDRATAAAADLSAAGFGSVESSSKMLGKALNDPLKGISALGRAGVTFTDQQKEQIKQMVKTGDTLGAQKLIMKEVESQVGGVAAASATAGEKFQVAFGNFKEQVGNALMPLLDKFFAFMVAKGLPALSRFASFLSANVGPAFGKVKTFLAPVIAAVRGFFASLQSGSPAAGFVSAKLVPAFSGLVAVGQRLGAVVLPIIRALAAEFLRRWPAIKPLVLSVFKSVGGIVTDIMHLIKSVISGVTTTINTIWSKWGRHITLIAGDAFQTTWKIIAGLMKVIGGIVKTVTGIMTGDWRRAGEGIKQIARGLLQALTAVWGTIGSRLREATQILLARIRGSFEGFRSYIGGQFRAGMNRLTDIILAPIRAARDKLAPIMSQMRDRFSSGVAAIGRAWDGLRAKAAAPIRFIINTVINGGLIKAFNAIARKVGANTLSPVPSFDSGGWTGPGARMKPAGIVHADEHVWTKEEMRRFPGGHKAMERWRQRVRRGAVHGATADLPGFAGGGAVGKITTATKTVKDFIVKTITRLVPMGGALKAALNKISMAGAGSTIFGDLAKGVAVKARDALYAKGKDWVQKIVSTIRERIPGGLGGGKSTGVSGGGRAGAAAAARRLGASYVAYHAETGSGRPAWDAGATRSVGDAIVRHLLANRGRYGLENAIWRRRIWSSRNWGGRPYTPIRRTGDYWHDRHVHATFDDGGYLRPGLTLAYNGTGQREKVLDPAETQRHDAAPLFAGPVSFHGLTEAGVAREIEKTQRRREALQPVMA